MWDKIVYLENQYIRVGILPEIAGRLFEGIDKTNNYNFIYRQHVIKPALICLIGAWICKGLCVLKGEQSSFPRQTGME
jgi:hypothetical protein